MLITRPRSNGYALITHGISSSYNTCSSSRHYNAVAACTKSIFVIWAE